MINFRYHIVSLMAVFIALSVGIAVGVSLSPSVDQGLLQQAAQDRKQVTDLRAELDRRKALDDYRNATGEQLSSVLSLMGPDDRTVRMRCTVGADDEPATCESPREGSRGGLDAYTAVAEFAYRAGRGRLRAFRKQLNGRDGRLAGRGRPAGRRERAVAPRSRCALRVPPGHTSTPP